MSSTIVQVGLTPEYLRGLVPLSSSDGNPLKINGQISLVPQPSTLPEPIRPEYTRGDSEDHLSFYRWCAARDLYSLAYSPRTLQVLEALPDYELKEISREIFPSMINQYLARKHGTVSCYNTGCKGILCNTANTVYHRERKGFRTRDLFQAGLEQCLLEVTESYNQYMTWLRYIRNWRREQFRSVTKNWQYVDLKLTLLLDSTQI